MFCSSFHYNLSIYVCRWPWASIIVLHSSMNHSVCFQLLTGSKIIFVFIRLFTIFHDCSHISYRFHYHCELLIFIVHSIFVSFDFFFHSFSFPIFFSIESFFTHTTMFDSLQSELFIGNCKWIWVWKFYRIWSSCFFFSRQPVKINSTQLFFESCEFFHL